MIPQLKRMDLPVEILQPDPLNPNVMSEKAFNSLVENIQEAGFTDPVYVWHRPDGVYQIIGGHHRAEAAKVLGLALVPCTITDDPDFSQEKAHFQLMKHNMLKGKLSSQKFIELYKKYETTYSKEQLTELFGFEEQAILEKMIKDTEKGLPKELKKKFKEASSEIKTIDDLSKVLNHLFATYGNTLPYGYMLIDFGGKDSIWLRAHASDKANWERLAARCVEQGKTLDGAFRILLQLVADHSIPQFESAFALLPKVKTPEGKMPTEDNSQEAA